MSQPTALKVLYAEDDPRDADLTRQYFLTHAPHITLDCVATGQQCLQHLRENKYDAVMLDQKLPDMDGLDILKYLIKEHSRIPAILVTGRGDERLVVQALQIGAVDYVTKTGQHIQIMPALLERVVKECRRRNEARLPTYAWQSRTVLYVERCSADVDLTQAHFFREAPHFSIECKGSCADALQLLQGPNVFDVVLVDLRMPDMSGLEFIRTLKMHDIHTPVIILTGKGDEETAVAAIKLGAYDYIVKRTGYLRQLPSAIDNAIARFRLDLMSGRLAGELEASVQSLDTKVAQRTEDLSRQINERRFAEQTVNALNEELERRVEERTHQLEVANQQLQSFSYSVSHDLRAPLRIISGYSRVLLDDKSELLDDEGKNMLVTIERQADQLSLLIEDLMSFCKVGQLDFDCVDVDMNSLVKEVVSDVMHDYSMAEAVTFVIKPLSNVFTDINLIRQVITNLITNAIKFSRSEEQPKVEVGCTEKEDLVEFYVRDNGVGFDMGNVHRLFKPFSRLHMSTEYEGTGIGLAIVSNIVTRHGGEVAAQSQPGEGSVFYFSLPKYPMSGSTRKKITA